MKIIVRTAVHRKRLDLTARQKEGWAEENCCPAIFID
jgi:hypothetical protein